MHCVIYISLPVSRRHSRGTVNADLLCYVFTCILLSVDRRHAGELVVPIHVLCISYYQSVDATTSGLLVLKNTICAVTSISIVTWNDLVHVYVIHFAAINFPNVQICFSCSIASNFKIKIISRMNSVFFRFRRENVLTRNRNWNLHAMIGIETHRIV